MLFDYRDILPGVNAGASLSSESGCYRGRGFQAEDAKSIICEGFSLVFQWLEMANL